MAIVGETATQARAFHVDVSDEALEDLRRRIATVRWPSRELVADRSQGVQLATIEGSNPSRSVHVIDVGHASNVTWPHEEKPHRPTR
jgi:hypothetical protein